METGIERAVATVSRHGERDEGGLPAFLPLQTINARTIPTAPNAARMIARITGSGPEPAPATVTVINTVARFPDASVARA